MVAYLQINGKHKDVGIEGHLHLDLDVGAI